MFCAYLSDRSACARHPPLRHGTHPCMPDTVYALFLCFFRLLSCGFDAVALPRAS